MLAPILSGMLLVSNILWRRLMACVALLFWLLSASAGVHAHFGQAAHHGPAAHHSAGPDVHAVPAGHTAHSDHAAHSDHEGHGAVISVHSLLDDGHEQQHSDGQQIDTGLNQLQSVAGKPGSKFDLSLLPVIPSHHAPGFTAGPSRIPVPSFPLKPPRYGSSAPPPLRAPPVRPA